MKTDWRLIAVLTWSSVPFLLFGVIVTDTLPPQLAFSEWSAAQQQNFKNAFLIFVLLESVATVWGLWYASRKSSDTEKRDA